MQQVNKQIHRFIIRDTNGKIVGQTKGYATHKGAMIAAGHYRDYLWRVSDEKHKANPVAGNVLVFSVRLETIED